MSSYQFAVIYLGLSQKQQAITALEDAYRERSTLLGYLKMDPRFGPIRSDPRLQNLLVRIHFPNYYCTLRSLRQGQPGADVGDKLCVKLIRADTQRGIWILSETKRSTHDRSASEVEAEAHSCEE
jgi:hypothetical protein